MALAKPESKELETRELLQTVAAIELYQAQVEVAKYLELGYIGVAEFPNVSKEVRLTAHAARTQHLMTSGLMKNYMVTAKHIVKTMIPLIFDGVDLGDVDIVKDCFKTVIDLASDMRNEATETKQRYYEIQTTIQNNIALAVKEQKDVKDKGDRIKEDLEIETKQAKESASALKELEDEQKEMEKNLARLKEDRDQWVDKSLKLSKDLETEQSKQDDTFLDALLDVPAGGPAVLQAASSIVKAGVNLFKNIFGDNRKEKHFQKVLDASQEAQQSIEKATKEKHKILQERQERRKEQLDRLHRIKQLNRDQADLGNIESLREASLQLGKVDRQFTRMIQFWENMVAMLKHLKDDTLAGEVYLKKIEDSRYADRFKASVSRAEKNWTFFGQICSDYVQTCEHDERCSINVLYGFLSVPIDNLSADQRNKRQLQLEYDIEQNIYADVDVGTG